MSDIHTIGYNESISVHEAEILRILNQIAEDHLLLQQRNVREAYYQSVFITHKHLINALEKIIDDNMEPISILKNQQEENLEKYTFEKFKSNFINYSSFNVEDKTITIPKNDWLRSKKSIHCIYEIFELIKPQLKTSYGAGL